MKEFIQGRRFGFAPRPQLGPLAAGLGIAVTLLDLMAWFGWGARDTNGIVIAAYWLVVTTAIVALLAAIAAFIESTDVAEDDRPLARLDLLAAFVAFLLYAVSAAFRVADQTAAAASPGAVVSALAGLIVLLVNGVIAATLYASREWEVPDEADYEPRRHQKGRRVS